MQSSHWIFLPEWVLWMVSNTWEFHLRFHHFQNFLFFRCSRILATSCDIVGDVTIVSLNMLILILLSIDLTSSARTDPILVKLSLIASASASGAYLIISLCRFLNLSFAYIFLGLGSGPSVSKLARFFSVLIIWVTLLRIVLYAM